jgi:hypothetical protein
MKRIIAVLLVLVLLSPVVFAQGRQNASAVGQQIAAELRYELKTRTPEGVRDLVQEKKEQIEQEIQSLDLPGRKAFRNQNQARIAVHTLIFLENLAGGIGPNVSAVAREFNNSVQATLNAEEKIEKRSRIRRFFAGGDHQAAEEINVQVYYNRERVEKLKQLRDECSSCAEEVMDMLQEQIENMEKEQARLEELAKKEKQSRGLLGWIWK